MTAKYVPSDIKHANEEKVLEIMFGMIDLGFKVWQKVKQALCLKMRETFRIEMVPGDINMEKKESFVMAAERQHLIPK